MNNKFKLTSAILTASLLVTPVSGIIYQNNNIAKAEEINNNKISENTKNKIKSDLKEYVSIQDIEKLIKKLENNEITEVSINSSKPIIEKEIKINEEEYQKIKIYKDFSYSITGLEKKPKISFRYLDNIHCGSGYCWATNAHAYKHVNGGEIGLYASLEYTNTYGQINSAWSPYAKQDGRNISANPIARFNQAGYSYASTSAAIHGQYYTITLKVGPYGSKVY
ncbi:hypothetical protein HZY83_01600 [Gemella sp. GH3]|uniref:hypothetical protein n=1 Tax=unclassified Gemella TaxID=2624949 RepID=UPI0015CF930D|nr:MULTISPECIES: hypothetical protein [unclassified Gemella]MBF0713386.1 hypothetical protein [Gemella sp. GH3.1]NYS50338.1 hypothetical protein [Gemella sp. GH3]